MDRLKYIQKKFGIAPEQKSPIRLPIERHREFPVLLNEMECRIGAEIGVRRGRFAQWLCHKIRPLKLYLIDPYLAYPEYDEYPEQADMDAVKENARNRMKKYNCEFVEKKSMDALRDFNDNSLDFVHIDANHAFDFVVRDIIEWSRKVKPGGIVSGHDYSEKFPEVTAAVNGWVQAKQISPLFTTKQDNWFYVK